MKRRGHPLAETSARQIPICAEARANTSKIISAYGACRLPRASDLQPFNARNLARQKLGLDFAGARSSASCVLSSICPSVT